MNNNNHNNKTIVIDVIVFYHRRIIHIYERDISFDSRRDGYGLTLSYHSCGILQQLDILHEIANHDCHSRSHSLFRHQQEEEKQIDRKGKRDKRNRRNIQRKCILWCKKNSNFEASSHIT
jgi:hypothetical protein